MAAQIAGWAGSALLILSLRQRDPSRFHVLNLVASALLGLFTLVVGAWPSVAVNSLSVLVNAHELWKLRNGGPAEASGGAELSAV